MFSSIWFFVILWTVSLQAPLSMRFSRQKYWSGLPFPPLGDLPNPGIEPASPVSTALAGRFSTTEPPGKPPSQIIQLLFKLLLLCWGSEWASLSTSPSRAESHSSQAHLENLTDVLKPDIMRAHLSNAGPQAGRPDVGLISLASVEGSLWLWYLLLFVGCSIRVQFLTRLHPYPSYLSQCGLHSLTCRKFVLLIFRSFLGVVIYAVVVLMSTSSSRRGAQDPPTLPLWFCPLNWKF